MKTFFGDTESENFQKLSKPSDWDGDVNSVFNIIGASNHSNEERAELDYYATDPIAVKALLYLDKINNPVWEPACGEGHISKVLENEGYSVLSTDLYYRGFGTGGIDFLNIGKCDFWEGDIVTNPPYKYATEFCYRCIDVIKDGFNVFLFLKLTFLEGVERYTLFKRYPPSVVYVSSRRLLCAKNGKFAPIVNGKRVPKEGFISTSAVAYCWFKWTKGYYGDTIIKWFDINKIFKRGEITND